MSRSIDPIWRVRSRKSEPHRPPWLEVSKETVELPDGRIVDDFYSVQMQDFGVVAAFTDQGEVVVERLYRHGPNRLTWSIPAGYVQEGESPLESTIRELREETGYEAEEWISAGSFIVDGNRGCGWCHCFVARGAHKVHEPRSDDLARGRGLPGALGSIDRIAGRGRGERARQRSRARLGIHSPRDSRFAMSLDKR